MTRSLRDVFSTVLAVALPALACAAPAELPADRVVRGALASPLHGQVTRVSDGDTLWLRPEGGGKPLKLRLQGIDAPELCQALGAEAREALRVRLQRQRVEATVHARDVYGRLLVSLRLQGQDVAAALVAEGWAWSEGRRGPAGFSGVAPLRGQAPYAAEEDAARAGRRGVHADAAAELPRDFRRRHGPCPH